MYYKQPLTTIHVLQTALDNHPCVANIIGIGITRKKRKIKGLDWTSGRRILDFGFWIAQANLKFKISNQKLLIPCALFPTSTNNLAA